MDLLINALIVIVLFAILAYGLYWICTHFFPNFPPALWITGAILLIIVLLAAKAFIGGSLIFYHPTGAH